MNATISCKRNVRSFNLSGLLLQLAKLMGGRFGMDAACDMVGHLGFNVDMDPAKAQGYIHCRTKIDGREALIKVGFISDMNLRDISITGKHLLAIAAQAGACGFGNAELITVHGLSFERPFASI